MNSIALPVLTAPEKPKWGEPCNGCGYCCAAEVCKLGRHIHGEDAPAPCPELRFHDGRFWCGVVEDAANFGLADDLRFVMGIGFGCDAEDFEETQ